jgi:hypothetical protein
MTLVHVPTAPAPLAERFLDRVERLTPEEWGRLDAVGARLTGADPFAAWARVRRSTTLLAAGRVPAPLATILAVVMETTSELVSTLRGRARWDAFTLVVPDSSPRAPAPHDAEMAQLRRLRDVLALQPGRPGPATYCVLVVSIATLLHEHLSPDDFARLYAPVESVIPLASL